MSHSLIRIGTRGSKLALAQADEVKNRLMLAHPHLTAEAIDIVPMLTTGDAITNKNLTEIGGKGLFTKEIEEALQERRIHMAVHSMKDMPALLPGGLCIAALLEREDPRDAFLSSHYRSIHDLPEGAVIGTSSSRRQAQLLHLRPDLSIIPFRGNVLTRLDKLHHRKLADATILAVAGLKRIHMEQEITNTIPTTTMLPAVAQGAIGVECRDDDADTHALLQPLNHPDTALCIEAERAFLAVLEGNCRTPMAALARLEGTTLHLQALIATTNGRTIHRIERHSSSGEAFLLGTEAGELLKKAGGPNFFC